MKAQVSAYGRKADVRDSVGSLHFRAENIVDATILTAIYKRYFLPDQMTDGDWKVMDSFAKRPQREGAKTCG
jgi:hypothetical protein